MEVQGKGQKKKGKPYKGNKFGKGKGGKIEGDSIEQSSVSTSLNANTSSHIGDNGINHKKNGKGKGKGKGNKYKGNKPGKGERSKNNNHSEVEHSSSPGDSGSSAVEDNGSFDEETVMSAFRELLKVGDKDAKVVYDEFQRSRDRNAFQASLKELVLSKSSHNDSGGGGEDESNVVGNNNDPQSGNSDDDIDDSEGAWERLVSGITRGASAELEKSNLTAKPNGAGAGAGFSSSLFGQEEEDFGVFTAQEAFNRWASTLDDDDQNEEASVGSSVVSSQGKLEQTPPMNSQLDNSNHLPPGLFLPPGLSPSRQAQQQPPPSDDFGFGNVVSPSPSQRSHDSTPGQSPPLQPQPIRGLPGQMIPPYLSPGAQNPHQSNSHGLQRGPMAPFFPLPLGMPPLPPGMTLAPGFPMVRSPSPGAGAYPPHHLHESPGGMGAPQGFMNQFNMQMSPLPPASPQNRELTAKELQEQQEWWRQTQERQRQHIMYQQQLHLQQQQLFQQQMLMQQQQQQQQQQLLQQQLREAEEEMGRDKNKVESSKEGRRSRSVSFSSDPVVVIDKDASQASQSSTNGQASVNPVEVKAYEPKRIVEVHNGKIMFDVPQRESLSEMFFPAVVTVRSRARVLVSWSLSPAFDQSIQATQRKQIEEAKSGSTPALPKMVLGLFRIGISSNKTSVVNKQIFEFKGKSHAGSGRMEFHAPRSAGIFVFRIFDENNPLISHASSPPFAVGVQYRDLDHNLKFVSQHLKAKKTAMALRQLAAVFEMLCGKTPWFQNRQYQQGSSPDKMLEDVVNQAIDCSHAEFQHVEDEISKIKERVRRNSEVESELAAATTSGGGGGGGNVAIGTDEPATDSKALRSVGDTHTALKLTLVAATRNPIVMSGLSDKTRSRVLEVLQLLCPMTQRFFSSRQQLLDYQKDIYEFGFINPLRPGDVLNNIPRQLFDALSDSMQKLLPSLLPTPDFDARREGVRYGLESIILSSLQTGFLGDNRTLTPLSVVPAGCSLHLFGSSRNGFGADSSDLDMCLLVPDNETRPGGGLGGNNLMILPPPKNRAEIVEGLGRVLAEASSCGKLAVLEELSTRPTARIPLVNFKLRGVDVDISVHNPLALRNSDMLKAYSKCDDRLIALAFIVKFWAKRRHVNNASEGTLSSYGYLLCLIHFLQTRNPPILPNLQAIPPNWDGQPRTAPREVPGAGSNGNSSNHLPSVPVAHPVDGRLVETYFYTPPNGDYSALRRYGQFNSQSVGFLFVEFFHYMTLQLEPNDEVISVRAPRMSKLTKAELECWPVHSRLSVEDPFEMNYDVAHPVKKQSRVEWMRAEFIRVIAVLENYQDPAKFGDALEEICAEAPVPYFLDKNRSRSRGESMDDRVRSNTIDQ